MKRVADAAGPHWEKRGNTVWLACPACNTWFPVSLAMLQPEAPACRCPRCGHESRPERPGSAG